MPLSDWCEEDDGPKEFIEVFEWPDGDVTMAMSDGLNRETIKALIVALQSRLDRGAVTLH